MLVKGFLTHPVGVQDSSPLRWDSRPVWLSPARPPERFPSASGTNRAQILTPEDPRLEGLRHRMRTRKLVPLLIPGSPLRGRAVSWAGLACSVEMPSLATAWGSPPQQPCITRKKKPVPAGGRSQGLTATAAWQRKDAAPGDTIPEAWPEPPRPSQNSICCLGDQPPWKLLLKRNSASGLVLPLPV